MSPVNSDDSSGDAREGAGRPLTRRELRAREKSLATASQSIIPEQAFETGPALPSRYVPDVPAGPAETATPVPDAPAPRAAPPSIQEPVPEQAQEAIPGPVHEPLPEAVHEPLPEPGPAPTAHHDDAFGDSAHTFHEDSAPHEEVNAGYAENSIHHNAASQQHSGDAYYATATAAHDYSHHSDDGHAYDDHDAYDEHHDYHQDEGSHEVLGNSAAVMTVSGPSKKVKRRRRFLALVLTLSLFVAALAVGAQFLKPLLGADKPSDYPGPGTGQVQVSVVTGEGPRSFATKLESQKVIANADTFIKEFTAAGGTLTPGDYTFRQEMKNSDAVAVLVGQDKGKVMYFALNAGLRIGESLQAISEGSGIPVAELKVLSDSPAQFGVPANAKNLEGFLAPGEYRFPVGTSAKDILQSLVKVTLDELKAQGITDAAKQYNVIIIASIVQAEGGQAEYGDVAGAIYNRLKPNNTETSGLVQSDATVTYGLGKKSFHIDEAEKADKSNLYNTYANAGLPVGPIGSPGKTAIDAAAKPKANDYLYWVTINLDTKETKFSKTLAEHLGYVEQYNAWCQSHAGRCV